MSVYEDVKNALQDIVAPELRTLQIEIKRLDEKIDSGLSRLDEKIDSGLSRLNEKIDSGLFRLDEKIESRFSQLNSRIDSIEYRLSSLERELHTAIEIHERLSKIEAKVGI